VGTVIVAALWLAGCTPTCERTCIKLLDCGTLESDRVSVEECEASCSYQISLYDEWLDERELDKAFDQHRRCLIRSSCEKIDAGECYDDVLFQVGEVDISTLGTSDTGNATTATGTSASTGTGTTATGVVP
jgi:hypothetical protein